MIRTTRFRRGPLRGWSTTVTYARRVDGDMPRYFVLLSDPTAQLTGVMAVKPGDDAYAAAGAPAWNGGGQDKLLAALDATIEQGRTWLDEHSELIPQELRPEGQKIVDTADHQRAEWV